MKTRILRAMLLCATSVLMALPLPSLSQDKYPERPVKIVIGFGPGSGTDQIARLIAEELRVELNQTFIVDNKLGASSQIAVGAVKFAPPDGYTLLLTSATTHSVNPHIFKNLPYDPIADFTPIGGIGYNPFILAVNADVPARTLREFVAWAHANKGKVFYAYGSPSVQVAAEALNQLQRLEATGVPYKSATDALTDVIAGREQFLVAALASTQPHMKSGRLRALAVTTRERTSLAPELPTVEESLGISDFDLAAWTGLFGPAGLPKTVVDTLSGALQRTLSRPGFREKLLTAGVEPTPSGPEAFGAMVKRQLEVWGHKVRSAGIKPE